MSHRSVRGSQSGFPLLTPIMETYDGPAWRLMATTLSAPFQGFARRSGIQVFSLYSTPSPVKKSQSRFLMVRVSRRTCGRGITMCVCFITAGPITKMFAWGEEESGGHVL